ncbi:hypothetical protein GVN18_38095 [Pseudomonas sp. ODNR1LW]|nr:hypothetical protein [Pseudomonas sp. ODNR1LW]
MDQVALVGMTVEPRRIIEAIDPVRPEGPDDTRLALVTARDVVLKGFGECSAWAPTDKYRFYVHDRDELEAVRAEAEKSKP